MKREIKKVVIIGATSAIATATARRFAESGADIFLLARNQERLEDLANDLRVRGAKSVNTAAFDALDTSSHAKKMEQALSVIGEIDAALIAHGELPDQIACQGSFEATELALGGNLLSPIAFLTWLGEHLAKRGSGNIAVISSVAGDRGRQSNYIYGAAKGALSIYLSGLRNRLYHHGVSVTTIKPGFVDTPMTSHLPKGMLFASAESVGTRIHRAMSRGEDTVYAPWFWMIIMGIITLIPEKVFKRMRL